MVGGTLEDSESKAPSKKRAVRNPPDDRDPVEEPFGVLEDRDRQQDDYRRAEHPQRPDDPRWQHQPRPSPRAQHRTSLRVCGPVPRLRHAWLDGEDAVEARLDKFLGNLRIDRDDAQPLTATEQELLALSPVGNPRS